MPLRFPVRRFVQSTEKTQAPATQFGSLQWVLARPLYRFHVIDLAQVPAKNRAQALKLELAQWTPFVQSDYYVGWHGHQALVWGWDAAKLNAAIASMGLKRSKVQVLPETLLQPPVQSGLSLVRCLEGFEGQLWRAGQLSHSRWWPQTPSTDEWLMFQRDAGLPPSEQQAQPAAPRVHPLASGPWLKASHGSDTSALQTERLAFAMAAMLLLVPTLWFGMGWYQLRAQVEQLSTEKLQLQSQATPIAQARSQALDHQARIQALRSLVPYPEQLVLMAKVTQVLPQDKSFLKDWDFQGRQLKFTVSSVAEVSATNIIGLLQQAGPFRDVKALPGRDPKSVTFQMDIKDIVGSPA